MAQSKIIAAHLVAVTYNDSIVQILESKQQTSNRLILNQQSALKNFQSKVVNQQLIIGHQKTEINQAKAIIENNRKVQKSYKRKSKFLSVGIAIVASILILK